MSPLPALLILCLSSLTYAQAQSRPPFDIDKFNTVRLAHGVAACLAFVAFFPLGAIAIRVAPGKLALRIHLAFQLTAYVLFIAAVGMGVWSADTLKLMRVNLFKHHHLIIGETVFACMALQVILGIVHHVMYRKHGRRQVWSYIHIWLGRAAITLGIINGGIGMQLGLLSRTAKIVYGVLAGLIWVVWMGTAVYHDARRFKEPVAGGRETRAETEENK